VVTDLRAPWALFSVLAMLAIGCDPEARYEMLSTLLDGVPTYEEWRNPPPPPERPVREVRYRQRPPMARVEQPKIETLFSGGRPDIENLETWEEVAAALPTDAAGGPDWQAALAQGIIAPLSSLEPGESTLEAFPLDVELTPEDPTFAATFRHETHTAWLACDNCHTAVFEMSTGAADITMESIYAGEHCGYCHGTVAFAAETGCAVCHAALAG
jgi:c(7)-type cytochrome triheme protein